MLPNTCACITHKNMQNFVFHSCLQISYQACLKCSWADVDESSYWSESEIPLILLVWAVTDIHTDIIEAHSLHISWKRKQGQLLSKSRSKKGVKPEEGFCGQRFYSAQKFVLVHTYTDTILYVCMVTFISMNSNYCTYIRRNGHRLGRGAAVCEWPVTHSQTWH